MGENAHQWLQRVNDLILQMGEHLANCSSCKRSFGKSLIGAPAPELEELKYRHDPAKEVVHQRTADLLVAS